MSSITIDYDRLGTISKNAKLAADRMDTYINDLTKNVSKKYSGMTGGASSKTQNSEYYVKQKIAHLTTKRDHYASFSTAVTTLSAHAKEIDHDVAAKIKTSKNDFIEKHDYIQSNWWTDIKEWFIDLKNSCPLVEAIGDLVETIFSGAKNIYAELKHWYKCGGGKEIIGFVLAIGAAICAVLVVVGSFSFSGIVAICALVAAIITAGSAIYNVVSSYQALVAKNNGDPAWAKIYGDRDTLQDGLRQTNFHNGTLNRLSYKLATGLDVVETVCAVVAIVDGIHKVANTAKEIKLSSQKGKVSFGKRLKQYLFNSDSYMKNKAGETIKWRDALQDRGKLRTLRTDNILYRATKAKTVNEFNKSLTATQKLGKKAKTYSQYIKYTQKFFDYTLGGDASAKNIGEDIGKGVAKKFNAADTFVNMYDAITDGADSFKSDYKGLMGIRSAG